ncbi:MAG TPA: pseudouridine synthase [Dissulfurispiraceae bacterium]|nr:pseudouridine synthase [Dissulfurispiraceae bacterium]
MLERIQKIIAQAGIASRRAAEDLIREGRVTVNGRPAVIGMKADPLQDHVKVDGKLITGRQPKVYYLFYKPRGVVTSMADPEGRPTVLDFFSGMGLRIYPVGRLDYDSEGILLVTNDGDFANAILHPAGEVVKTYAAKVRGDITDEQLERLRKGLRLEDGMTAPAKVRRIKAAESNSWVQIAIHEGRNRQVRRMFEKVGHPVLRLKRISVGDFSVGRLKPGEYRELSPAEVKSVLKRKNNKAMRRSDATD